jgi:hypothetical protein
MSPNLVLLKVVSEEVIVRSWRWLVMVLSFSAVSAAVATVTRFRVLETLFGDHEGDCRKDCENFDSSDNRAHNLLKY